MQCFLPSFDYPFASADSTDIARNHNRLERYGEHRRWATINKADRWDQLAVRAPSTWIPREQRTRRLAWIA